MSSTSVAFRNFVTRAMAPKNKKQTTKAEPTPKPSDDPPSALVEKNGNVYVTVLAKPGASQSQVVDVTTEAVHVQIGAPPVDGEANAELVKYLSKVFGVRKSDVSLDRGAKNRNKVVIVSGISVSAAMLKLKSEME